MNSSNEKTWLVKSSGTILGPYSIDDMIQALEDKKISLIDEIRDPESRWCFIREHAKFKDIVQFLRERQTAHKEDTSTTFVGTKTLTQTATMEVTKTPVLLDDEDLTRREPEPVKESPVARSSKKSYGSAQDKRVQKVVKKQTRATTRLAWTFGILILLAGVGAVVKIRSSSVQKPLTFVDWVQRSEKELSLGLFEKSLNSLRQAQSKGQLSPEKRLQLASLMMVVENQNLAARQQVEDILPELRTRELEEQAENFLATSHLRDGNLEEAQKRFDYLLEKDPSNLAAETNSLTLQILQGQFESALTRISEMVKKGALDATLPLYRSLIAYHLDDDGNSERLQKASAEVEKYIAANSDYKSEALLLLAGIQKKMGQELEMVSTLQKLLSLDPDSTREHIHDYQIHREVLQWSYLANFCDRIASKGSESALLSGLKTYCLYQKGEMKPALDAVELARNQYGKNDILAGLHGFLLLKSGRLAEAKALTVVVTSPDALLLQEIKGEICESEKDWNCAEQTWNSILERNPSNLRSLEGQARILAIRGQTEKARDIVRRGLLISPNYRPLIEMKEAL